MDGLEKERGRIKIDDRLRVPGVEGVFAMGDAAVNPQNPLGPLAQVADQQGKVGGKIVASAGAQAHRNQYPLGVASTSYSP